MPLLSGSAQQVVLGAITLLLRCSVSRAHGLAGVGVDVARRADTVWPHHLVVLMLKDVAAAEGHQQVSLIRGMRQD